MSCGYLGWTLPAADVVALPVDELGLAILRDIVHDEGAWHVVNWLLAIVPTYEQHRQGAVRRALSEGWAWLYRTGLVARNYDQQHAPEAFFVTRLGHDVATKGPGVVRAAERLALTLHPAIEAKVRPQFLMGEYGHAVFVAMRALEVAVREAGGFSNSDLGVSLMRAAFGVNGPLRAQHRDTGENNALMELYAGAAGYFKNPASHREVDFDDPTEAAEVILFADLLFRILDRRRLSGS